MGNKQSKGHDDPKKKDKDTITFMAKKSTLPQFMTEMEFFEIWNTWKTNFLIEKTVKKDSSDKRKWGNKLLNYMGPIGQNIYNTFTFNSLEDKEDIDVLLKKFDEYYLFSGRKKLPLEDVYEYINDLQLIIKQKNIENKEQLIKNKIIKEIDEHKFNDAAKHVIPTFKFSLNFNQLSLKEIAFIWMLYIDYDKCGRCGSNHTLKNCPAMGKKCLKCKDLNHFARRCPMHFNHNCTYCGGSHTYRKCPAFNEICTKCKKLNHFSWRCQKDQILQCNFCNLSHIASRSVCPARNTICGHCKMIGHFTSKCRQNHHK